MTLLAQEYLLTHSLNQLKTDHGVNYRVCGNKFSLNYDMIEASNTDPLACQCRGVVLAALDTKHIFEIDPDDVIGSTEVMARTMDRFFNHGQDCAADVNFEANGTRFYEKLDGTMVALYYDFVKKEWHTATRSVPEADLPVDGFDDLTFRGLFEKAILETTGLSFSRWLERENLYIDMTYVFELCTPVNRVVVEHKDYKAWSIAILHRDGQEENIEDPGYGLNLVPKCRTYELNNLTDMIDFVSGRDPTQYEGIVAVDKSWKRVKVKNPGYLALSRAKDVAMRSPRALLELCLLGKLDDAVPLLPDHVVDRAQKIETGLKTLLNNSGGLYDKVLERAHEMREENNWTVLEHRKAMALATKELAPSMMAYVMMRYTGKVESFMDYVKSHIDPKTGQYKRNFLDFLLLEIEK